MSSPRIPRLTANEFRRTPARGDFHDVRGTPGEISVDELRRILDRDDPVILELGCHDGRDTQRFLDEFPRAVIHCFEPDPRPAARFQIDDARCQLHQVAISAEDGRRRLYLSGGSPSPFIDGDWDYSSSIRNPTGHLVSFPWCTFERSCEVEARSLDSWMDEHPELTQIDFIWADLQGAEGELIQGGRVTLREKTRYLYTEFYERPMYEGQPTQQEILGQLPEFVCLGTYRGENMLLQNSRFSN